jgi:GNAT superfamily N-acetyltransferase
MDIREASAAEDDVLIRHYLALWASYEIFNDQMRPDASEQSRAFIRDSRAHRQLAVFHASVEGEVVGSVACDLRILPYPEVVRSEFRKQGYIWSVFVEPAHRRKGIARRLVERAIAHLRSIGCTVVMLNASEDGEPLYAGMGFVLGKEMRFTF